VISGLIELFRIETYWGLIEAVFGVRLRFRALYGQTLSVLRCYCLNIVDECCLVFGRV
jgi:hypothetical protein